MHMTSRSALLGVLAAVGLAGSAMAVTAAPLPTRASASGLDAAPIQVDYRRWYRDYDYYYPPRPPVRAYRYVPPPAIVYEPPVYGWLPPPRPASCGKYRYWNGEYCADARFEPPYTGPRW